MKYFTKKELSCKCCGVNKCDSYFLEKLESLRIEFGRPMKVNSCYRCLNYNKKIGGLHIENNNGSIIKVSNHVKGIAIDIQIPDSEYRAELVKVALPEEFLGRQVDKLSGGEQQRVSLARSLANQPQILLLDEPTSGLDMVSEEIFEETIKKLSFEGIKIIIVTHSLEQTKRLTNQLLFLRGGRLIEKIPTQDFFQKYNDTEIRGLFKDKEVK